MIFECNGKKKKKNYFAAEWSLRKISPSVKILRRPFMELTLHTPAPSPHCHCCLCCTILKNLKRAFFFSRDLAFKPLALNGLCQYHHSKWIYQQRYFFENMFFFTSSWWWKCWWWERTETEIEFVGNFSLLFPRVHCFPCYSIEIEFVRNISRSSIQCTLAHHTQNFESMDAGK